MKIQNKMTINHLIFQIVNYFLQKSIIFYSNKRKNENLLLKEIVII